MKTKFILQNPFRPSLECYSGIVLLMGCLLLINFQPVFLLSGSTLIVTASCLGLLGLMRLSKGLTIIRFQKRLLDLKVFSKSTTEVPLYDKHLYTGVGFQWQGLHTQRKNLINEIHNETFQHQSKQYRWARHYEQKKHNLLANLLKSKTSLNPLRELPDIGGKPWLHGLGDKETEITINESIRNGHLLLGGTTRVGKTRQLAIMVNQDIRRGKAVIFLDPKGDLDILRDIYSACKASNRMQDFKIVHVGFPTLSVRLNTLSSFTDISDVATRVTSSIGESGEGAQFKAFAWQYVNIVAKCLYEMNETINYRSISFYIKRPEILLLKYADLVFPKHDPNYLKGVEEIIRKDLENQVVKPESRTRMKRSLAIKLYLQSFIEKKVSNNDMELLVNHVIVPLYDAAALDISYYHKITASVGPVLDMINQSNASEIFSFADDCELPEVKLIEAIKRKQVIYIGLNSLVNRKVSEALGKAIISDLVSSAGQIYNSGSSYPVSIYCDEFSEIVQDEFVTLLNKAGGSGFQVVAAVQTINDVGAAFSGNHDKAMMLEGNFQTLMFLRVKNEDTANILIRQLPEVEVISHSEGSSSSDTARNDEGVYFHSSQDLRITLKPTPTLQASDLMTLPKGHAFVLTNGGELYKVRSPLPQNDGLAPQSFIELIERVNSEI